MDRYAYSGVPPSIPLFCCTLLVDLGMHGKENTPANSFTASQSYEALEVHETACRDLSFRDVATI